MPAEAGVERTDLRFMLSRPPRTVALLGPLRAAAEAFALVGLEVVDGAAPADLVLADPAGATEAIARARVAVALEGRHGVRALAAAGLAPRRLLALPDTARPTLVLPLDRRAPLRYATRHLLGRASRAKIVRNRVAPPLLARGLVLGGRALAVAEREPGPPALVAAAREAGLPADGDFLWMTGSSDVLSRGALFVFGHGQPAPEWVIKFGRVPGARAAFDRDAAGLALAAGAGGRAASHAPRLLARLEVAGLPAAAETAARGERLGAFLGSAASHAAKRRAIDRVAGWIVAYGAETASSPPAIAPELARLRHDVIPAWEGARDDLLAGLEHAPAVLQHNDLGTWNVLVAGDGFTAVDWESARPAGLPLWDLAYFLAYAILALDQVPLGRQEAHLVEAFLGRTSSSALLFEWIRRAVAALALEPRTVGRLVTTGWLHHGLSHVAREVDVRAAGGEPASEATALPRRLARRWLLEPGLGAGWSRWRDA